VRTKQISQTSVESVGIVSKRVLPEALGSPRNLG
jgi:hypothetical protein